MKHHLAIIHSGYVDAILARRKTIECRMSSRPRPPFAAVRPGDVVWVKLPSGPVCAVLTVAAFRLVGVEQPGDVRRIEREVAGQVLAPPAFWRNTQWVRTIGLITIGEALAVAPFRIEKSDRSAWVPLADPPRPGAAVRRRIMQRGERRLTSAEC